MKTGWIRFMDETPEIGEEIVVAVSLAYFNGYSSCFFIKFTHKDRIILNKKKYDFFMTLTKADDEAKVLDKLGIPIYNSEYFDRYNHNNISYAHHWAYNIEENKIILPKQDICEYKRIIRGEKHPVIIV